MMYVLVLEWDMTYDGFTIPIPFRADGDDDARLIALALMDRRYCGPTSGNTQLGRCWLYSLDDNRELNFNSWPR